MPVSGGKKLEARAIQIMAGARGQRPNGRIQGRVEFCGLVQFKLEPLEILFFHLSRSHA